MRAREAVATIAAASALAGAGPASSSSSAVVPHPPLTWTVCQAAASGGGAEKRVPPSRWSDDGAPGGGQCFLRGTDAARAPGTALYQRWLADHAGSDEGRGVGRDGGGDEFDPRTDFPTWEVLKKYPDIGEGDAAREYYTLWYAAEIDPPGEGPRADGGAEQVGGGGGGRRWRRGHLTLRGVNYRPVVRFDGTLLRPYSTSPDAAREDAGGMFLRRHYDLGTSSATDEGSRPLEILVLPPPHVGEPTPLDRTEVSPSDVVRYGLEGERCANVTDAASGDVAQDCVGQGGDHLLARSGAVMQFGAGWDWIRSTPDRNAGIWDAAEVEWIRGDVRLHDARVRLIDVAAGAEDGGRGEKIVHDALREAREASAAPLPLGDDVPVSARAKLSVVATLHGDPGPVRGSFEYVVSPKGDPDVVVARGVVEDVIVRASVAEYDLGTASLRDVRLWWPCSHSARRRQPLYVVRVAFRSRDDGRTDDDGPMHHAEVEASFGIRTVSSFTHPRTKSFALRVNGRPIYLAGGNWIATDQFLRYATSSGRYFRELALMRHAGLNAVRVWGGGLAETEGFYDAADALGVLVYQEFWMTGDNNGRYGGEHGWPDDKGAYLANAEDVVRRLRNRPSLAWYGGGNELNPVPTESSRDDAEVSPPKEVEDGLRELISRLDGTRPYVTSSVMDVGAAFDPERALGPKDGPYGVLPEGTFFERNPGLTSPLLTEDEVKRNATPSEVADAGAPGRNIGFQAEIGSVSHPELESLRRFLSPEALDAYPNCGERSEVGRSVHPEWMYWKYLPFTDDRGVDYVCRFAFPPYRNGTDGRRMGSIEDYTWAAQFGQYLQYKSLFEGHLHRAWERTSATFLWKVQSPAPTLRGALFDWYGVPNGGGWGVRAGAAGGRPVRAVLNPRDRTVHVINVHPDPVRASAVEWTAYSLPEGRELARGTMPVPAGELDGDAVAHLEGSLPWVGERVCADGVPDVVLYRLRMPYSPHEGSNDDPHVATNEYFLTDPSMDDADDRSWYRYSLLGSMRGQRRIRLSVGCRMSSTSGIECSLRNGAENGAAILTKLTVAPDLPADEVALTNDPHDVPIMFVENYLTLLPGESSPARTWAEADGPAGTCSSDGFAKAPGRDDVDLLVVVDGWNLRKRRVRISCHHPSMPDATASLAA